MVADALRSTLDSLQLDPSVQKDRHYLITMLRRLGYTEVEIRQALGEIEEPAKPIVETEVTTVELEYSEEEDSFEVPDFDPVTPVRKGGFIVQTEPAVSFEEVEDDVVADDAAEFEILEAEEAPKLHFEEIAPPAPGKRTRLRVVRAESPEEAAEIARSQGQEVVHTVPVNVRKGKETSEWGSEESFEAQAFDEPAFEPTEDAWEWNEEPATEPAWQEESEWSEPEPDADEWAATDAWEEPAEVPADSVWEAAPVEEATWQEPVQIDETPADPWEAEQAPVEAVAEPAPATDGSYYSRNEYVLHMRKAKLPSGKTETLYFFAKGVSESGTPIELPAGYVVREHPGSKLPYIIREDA